MQFFNDYQPPIRLVIISLSLCLVLTTASFSYSTLSSINLRDTILILDRATTNSIKQLQENQEDQSELETKEFRSFIAYLSGRIDFYCQELERSLPPVDTSDLPCNPSGSTQLTSSDILSSEMIVETKEDEIAKFDESLDSALGQFDEMLLKEQEEISSQQASQRTKEVGKSATTAGSFGESGQAGNEQQDNASEKTASANQNNEPAGATGKGTGTTTNQTSNTSPKKRHPSMEVDDDIVARQLREAAEKETDPEIKEKLWEEYRKYKQGVR